MNCVVTLIMSLFEIEGLWNCLYLEVYPPLLAVYKHPLEALGSCADWASGEQERLVIWSTQQHRGLLSVLRKEKDVAPE